MEKRNVLHVVHSKKDDRWEAKQPGINFPIYSHENKEPVVEFAISHAKAVQPSQVKIHGKDGKIQSERTYKRDPFPPLG